MAQGAATTPEWFDKEVRGKVVARIPVAGRSGHIHLKNVRYDGPLAVSLRDLCGTTLAVVKIIGDADIQDESSCIDLLRRFIDVQTAKSPVNCLRCQASAAHPVRESELSALTL